MITPLDRYFNGGKWQNAQTCTAWALARRKSGGATFLKALRTGFVRYKRRNPTLTGAMVLMTAVKVERSYTV